MATADKLRSALQQVEYDAQLLLDAKKKMVEADRERNGLREAATALRKWDDGAACDTGRPLWAGVTQNDVWVMQPGGVVLKLNRQQASEHISGRQALQERLVKELRAEEKRLMAQLADKGGVMEVQEGVLKALLTLKDDK
mmetsp:Transcript_38366/g.108447  ORF Transcript_38366/g.108447 Transcript_38366/m.108447 type:complete len:140 (+) Transcript_38366:265-684(+)|eukprot:CAMPEP_0117674008 /NCGR_PEP_ID=MMETSP0804-20121206/14796_1 /TAXON_ID=1074897 /ORGANISM="Tetraselmis astigmatica, Strain CCMP880" /LENGTH=139 /DNA_ID=CAMNT_0005482823 /DNA_START=191 /DNA_END=610 /DNA_ORIENTATION=+